MSILLKYWREVSTNQHNVSVSETDLDRLDLQLERRILVHDDHRVRVELEARERPHVIDSSLDALLERDSLVSTGNDDDDLVRLKPLASARKKLRQAPTSNTVWTPTVNAILGT